MIETLISWSLLPLGVVLGIALAKRGAIDLGNGPGPSGPPSTEMPPSVSADSDRVELQLTLGSLFRKRGELDRAIQLHEAVLARPSLSPAESAQARLELAQDFLRGGVIDRAESLLDGLVAGGQHLDAALELLLDLHEQGRDWPRAMSTAGRLQAVQGRSQAKRIAHHHCELAENARHDGALDTARQRVDKALDADRDCARASLLLAALCEAADDWRGTLKASLRAVEQDRRYLPEVLPLLRRCHEQLDDAAGYEQFLADAEIDHPDSMAVALARADWLVARDGDAQAYLAARLLKSPSWRGLLAWVDVAMPGYATAGALTEAFRKRLAAQPRYACSGCGLKPGVLFWQCPGCRQWATIAPARDEV
jgi:lipopolysaccharide biosynthesis regulator YciM